MQVRLVPVEDSANAVPPGFPLLRVSPLDDRIWGKMRRDPFAPSSFIYNYLDPVPVSLGFRPHPLGNHILLVLSSQHQSFHKSTTS